MLNLWRRTLRARECTHSVDWFSKHAQITQYRCKTNTTIVLTALYTLYVLYMRTCGNYRQSYCRSERFVSLAGEFSPGHIVLTDTVQILYRPSTPAARLGTFQTVPLHPIQPNLVFLHKYCTVHMILTHTQYRTVQ